MTSEPAGRGRLVLLVLLSRANDVVSTETIIDELWGGRPPKTARNSVARFVADLRRCLGPLGERIITVTGGYRLEIQPGELDVDLARAFTEEARLLLGDDPELSFERSGAGLDLFRAWPNLELTRLEHHAPLVRSLDELHVELLELDARARIRAGDFHGAVASLEPAVDAHPSNERFWELLMVALYRTGRPSEALAAYGRLSEVLGVHGLEASPEIRRLETEILTHETSVVDATAPADASPDDVRAELYSSPRPRTSLVGRVRELDEIERALRDHRIVTLTGVGGVGKSRLAWRVAQRWAERGRDVRLLSLDALGEGTNLVRAVAAVAGLPSDVRVSTALDLARALWDLEALLVIDAAEHAPDACVEIVDALLDHAPGVQVLVTSRMPLRVGEERLVKVHPLPLRADSRTSPDATAVALFVARAGISAAHEIPAATLAVIEDICQAAGCLPLAVELAAAQVSYSDLEEVRDQLALELTRVGPSDRSAAGAVQQALQWSWGSLTDAQRLALARLSVFGGSWTLPGAAAVLGDELDAPTLVATLVDRGLVIRSEGSPSRFSLLPIVARFAADQLERRHETQTTSDRAVGWLHSLTEGYELLDLHSFAETNEVLVPEHANVVAALARLSASGRREELVALALRFCGMWIHHGRADAIGTWLTDPAEDPTLSPRTRSAAAYGLMLGATTLRDLDGVISWALKSAELAGDAAEDWLPHVFGTLAVLASTFPLPLGHEDYLRAAHSVAGRTPSKETNQAIAHLYDGMVRYGFREFDDAVDRFVTARSHGFQRGRLRLLGEVGLGLSLALAGRSEEALAEVASWTSDPRTDRWHHLSSVARAIVVGWCGHPVAATEELSASLVDQLPSALSEHVADFQVAFGMLADMRGEPDFADELLSSAHTPNQMLLTALIEHVGTKRQVQTKEEYLAVALELVLGGMSNDRHGHTNPRTRLGLIRSWSAAT